MQVILLERVEKLGAIGDVVKVKDGYARNFLLPQRKALRATADNRAQFERQRADIESVNAERRSGAEAAAKELDGKVVTLLRQSSDSGQLFGSVTSRDIAAAASATGVEVERRQVMLDRAIKNLGVHPIRINLHPEVPATVHVIVARSNEEAEVQRQAFLRGETAAVTPEQIAAAEAEAEAEAFFDEGAGPGDDEDQAEDTSAEA